METRKNGRCVWSAWGAGLGGGGNGGCDLSDKEDKREKKKYKKGGAKKKLETAEEKVLNGCSCPG